MYVTVSINGKKVPTMPLSIVKIHTADSEVASSAQTLSKNSTMLSIFGLWLPIGMLVAGILLVAVAIRRWRRPASNIAW